MGRGTEPCPPRADPGPGLRGPRSSRNPRRSHPAPMLQTDKSRLTALSGPRPRRSPWTPRFLPSARSHRDAGPPGCLERPGSDGTRSSGGRGTGTSGDGGGRAPAGEWGGPGERGRLVVSGPSPAQERFREPHPSASRPLETAPSCPPRAIPAAPARSLAAPAPDPGAPPAEATGHRVTLPSPGGSRPELWLSVPPFGLACAPRVAPG